MNQINKWWWIKYWSYWKLCCGYIADIDDENEIENDKSNNENVDDDVVDIIAIIIVIISIILIISIKQQ